MTNARKRIIASIHRTTLSLETKHYIIALLLGDRKYIDQQTRSEYSYAGISHVLALSGLHIGIIMIFIWLLLWPLDFYQLKKLRFILSVVILRCAHRASSFGSACHRDDCFHICHIHFREKGHGCQFINGISTTDSCFLTRIALQCGISTQFHHSAVHSHSLSFQQTNQDEKEVVSLPYHVNRHISYSDGRNHCAHGVLFPHHIVGRIYFKCANSANIPDFYGYCGANYSAGVRRYEH